MTLIDKYERVFNEIDARLRGLTGMHDRKNTSFTDVVEAAKPYLKSLTKEQRGRLLILSTARNLITHNKGVDYTPLVPTKDALRELELFRRLITEYPVIASFPFISKITGPQPFEYDTLLTKVLKCMKDSGFSQVILRNGERELKLLSVEGITRWLENKAYRRPELTTSIKIGDVARCEPSGTCEFMGINESALNAIQIFTKPRPRRVCAIIVTQSGAETEKPLFILTPWDIARFVSS